jgi:hypothetical protein
MMTRKRSSAQITKVQKLRCSRSDSCRKIAVTLIDRAGQFPMSVMA